MTLTVLKITHMVFVEYFVALPELRHVHFLLMRTGVVNGQEEGVTLFMAHPVYILSAQLSLLVLTSITWLKWYKKCVFYKL